MQWANTFSVRPQALVRSRFHFGWPRWLPLAFWLPWLLYVVAAVWLVLVVGSIQGDAWARVGNGYYVFFSRDPHLAAMGFVWSPLPTLAIMPMLPFQALWPELTTHGFSASIMSASFMAGAVYQLRGHLADLRVWQPAAVMLTAAFALHPMVVHYGANGMTEGAFVFVTLWAVRNLWRWTATGSLPALVVAALAIALAYLTRMEGAIIFMGSGIYVMMVSYKRANGSRRERLLAAGADIVVLSVPFVAAFVGWALASWLIVGRPFEVFGSAYGNSTQLEAGAEMLRSRTGQGTDAATSFVSAQLIGLFVTLPAIIAVSLAVSVWRRTSAAMIPFLLFGLVLVFEVWAFLTGRTFGVLRYYIVVVPLAFCLAALMMRDLRVTGSSGERIAIGWLGRVVRVATAAAIVAPLFVALPTAGQTMLDPTLGYGEEKHLAMFRGEPEPAAGTALSHEISGEVAAYLDAKGLPEGSVIVDTAIGYGIVLHSDHPRQFVITPDRDFPEALGDPGARGVRYLLISQPGGGADVQAALDAVRRTYPSMYESGAGIARLERDFVGWRLYEVNEQ